MMDVTLWDKLCFSDWLISLSIPVVKRPTRHSIGHFGDGGPGQWCAPPIQ